MSDEESVIVKIRKLLEKASSTDNLNEKEVFMLKSQELLQKYNLEMSQIEKHVVDVKNNIVEILVNYSEEWERKLLNGISNNNFCKTIMLDEEQSVCIGKGHNIEVVIYLHSFFRRAIVDLSMKAYSNMLEEKRKLLNGDGIDIDKFNHTKLKNNFMKNFIYGAMDGVIEKLRLQKKEAQKSSSNLTSLIVYNDNAIDIYIKEVKGWNLINVKNKVKPKADTKAYKQGFKEGKGITVHEGVDTKNNSTKYLK